MEVGQIGLHGADVTLTAGKLETGFAIIQLHFLMELIVLETALRRTLAMEKIAAQETQSILDVSKHPHCLKQEIMWRIMT